MSKWLIFINERFSPLAYLAMIASFLFAHYALVNIVAPGVEVTLASTILLAVGATAFFLKLRLYDEVKDYGNDLEAYPNRPLPRGLLTVADVKKGIAVCLSVELLAFWFLGLAPLLAMTITVLYSLLMYNEFFLREYLRLRLTAYALAHTAVSVLLSLAIYSGISNQFIWQLDPAAYFFALSSWCLFNIFEFGRKTFSSEEERAAVESYSKLYGRFGAVSLTGVMVIGMVSLLYFTPLVYLAGFWPFMVTASVFLGATALAYAFYDKLLLGKIYRAASSVFIIVIYGGIVLLSLDIA